MEERKYRSPNEVYRKGRKVSDILKDEEIDLAGADLREIAFHGTNLTNANLFQANLTNANLIGSKLKDTNLWRSNYTNANLWGANLTGARLNEATFIGVNLYNATLRRSRLNGATLAGANLYGADLSNAKLSRVRYSRKGSFRSIKLDGVHDNQRFVRFAKDQAYLEELKSGKWHDKIWYWIWLIFADCGRTPWAWIGWSVSFAFLFAWKFYSLEQAVSSSFKFVSLPADSFWTFLYYNIVTFTTLGFGDITPNTPQASFWVGFEVIVGYVMLGGLISILATKLARRS